MLQASSVRRYRLHVTSVPPIDGHVRDATSICVGCGLCCDGTLHPAATVKAAEVRETVAAGFDLVEEGGKLEFSQPCPKFAAGCCSIYSNRPPVCRRYRCALLIAVDDGRISKAEAVEKIAVAKDLVARVVSRVPDARLALHRKSIWKSLQNDFEQLSPDERHDAGRVLVAIAALDHFLGQWFRKKKPDRNHAS